MSRKIYHFTPEMDEEIRRVYLTEVAFKPVHYKGPVRDLAAKFGMPRWRVSRRARDLGVIPVQKKEPRWSERELNILQSSAHLTPERIQIHLKRAGYSRSIQGICLKRKRMRCLKNLNGHSATSVAMCFGVDIKAVTRWIEKGWLKAKKRGTKRTAIQGGDQWWIKDKWIRDFITESVAVIDFRKVDKYWVVDLLAGGR